jgi:hypothetical protein
VTNDLFSFCRRRNRRCSHFKLAQYYYYYKKTEKKNKKKDKKNKKDNKEKERGGRKDTDFTQSKGERDDSSTKLEISMDGSSGSLDASSSSCNQDHCQHHRVSGKQLRTIKVDEQQRKDGRGERRQKREAAKKKTMPEVDMQDKRTADNTAGNIKDDRREPVFLQRPVRMPTPTPEELKRMVAKYRVASTAA